METWKVRPRSKRRFEDSSGRACVGSGRSQLTELISKSDNYDEPLVKGGACKNLAPSPGNRSSRYEDLAAGQVYREEDLATGRDWITLGGGPGEREETRYEKNVVWKGRTLDDEFLKSN
ncbi:hypothetical protein NPIL_74261 [Nephila pilipes]|uniref:Uncharacterized protein n=1 Tax=Nephila pilipes TaxID=299642 RepID=A0A8X6PT01_NEPPI|nr:hypothetical protein NPIL_74261 [Nephila pilipes]